MTLALLLLILSFITFVACAFGAQLRNINLEALGLAFGVASLLAAYV